MRSIVRSCGVEEMLKKGAAMIGWDDRGPPGRQDGALPAGHRGGPDASTPRAPGRRCPGDVIDYSTAMVKVNEDGSVDFSTALM